MSVTWKNLEGVDFVHGKEDCFEIGRKFFKQNWNIDIPDFVRPDKWWEAEEAGLNLYYNHYHECGFRLLDDLPMRQWWPGDVFLMAIETKIPCHSGIWLGEGNLMLHHMIGRKSKAVFYKGLWKNSTVAMLRHKEVPPPDTSSQQVDLMELLPQNVRQKLENAAAT